MQPHTALQATRQMAKQNLREMRRGEKPARQKIHYQKNRRTQTHNLFLDQMHLKNPALQRHLKIVVLLTQFKLQQINTLILSKHPSLLMDLKCPTPLTHQKHSNKKPQAQMKNKFPFCFSKVVFFLHS